MTLTEGVNDMSFTGSKGHCIDPYGNIPGIAAEALTLPQQDVALAVCYNGSVTNGIPQIKLPDSDGEKPCGVVYGKSYASGDHCTVARKGRVWMVTGEASIVLGEDLMTDADTGYVLIATSAKDKLGTAASAQASSGGLILVELELGTHEPA
jgi:hypothetical protein